MRSIAKSAAVIAAAATLLAVLPQTAAAQSTPEKRKVNVATASLGLPYLPLIIAQIRQAERCGRKIELALLRRSEEHTSELQSLRHLVCRLLLVKKKNS